MSGFISTTPAEREAMLARIGVATLDDLFRDLPAKHYRPQLDLPAGLSEMETWQYLRGLSETNLDLDRAPSFLGAGAYRHYAPAAIGHLISRSEFLTSYTPYQPEVSQGTLQAVYEWQSMVCALTGMDVANASVYDAGTGVGEAARMAARGRVSYNRLTRDEYVNTVRDLLGVEFDAKDPGNFLEDPEWRGFERIGSVLTLSPSNIEKYLAAAETILAEAYPEPAQLRKGQKPPEPDHPAGRRLGRRGQH